jgi:hypothetical protein
MKRSIGWVVGRIVERPVERLLNSRNRKVQNSGVSKQWSHNFIVTFPYIRLDNKVLGHNSGEFGQAGLEAFMMQSEQVMRQDQASV